MAASKVIILLGTNLFFTQKMATQLKQAGHTVYVESSYEGVRGKAGAGVSAVVIDLAAKGMDAVDILKKMKASPETKAIPTLGFCGHADTALMDAARSAGCGLVVTNGVAAAGLPAHLDRL